MEVRKPEGRREAKDNGLHAISGHKNHNIYKKSIWAVHIHLSMYLKYRTAGYRSQ